MWRVIVGVCLVWTLAGVVLAGQSALDVAMRGGRPTPLSAAFIQTLPWIPVTLAAIWLAIRFPIRRERWAPTLAIHLIATVLLAFVANMIVVAAYMFTSGQVPSIGVLVRQGALWGTLRVHVVLVIYAASVAVTQVVLYYRETRARELNVARLEGQLARARLQMLNAQIRPHFLFNTLHTIGQLWRSGRSDDADAVLDHLGSLFHKVQSSTARFEVSLAEELEMVREYLAIEETRFRDRLRTSVRASDRALGCHVPPLILQPLVENAIRHGISTVSSARRVDVSADVIDERLQLTVRDDGPGMQAASPSRGSGTGLRNTRERLTQLYGDDARLVLDRGPNGGVVVCVDLPLCRQPTLVDG